MELLSVSEEVFAVGTTSNIVAAELAGLGWNKARKKVRVALIIDYRSHSGNL